MAQEPGDKPGQKPQKQSFWEKVKPWQCAVCGHKNISANDSACPACGAPRAGSPAALAEDASGQTTRVYEGDKALQDGIAQMARGGWRVVSQSSFQPSSGVGRTVALGFIGALVFKPPAKFTVVFERIPSPPAP